MGKSLQEQLLNTGLVDKDRAREIDRERQKAKRRRRGKETAAAPDRQASEARKAQVERDQRLNRQRLEKTERRAAAAQIRQMILAHRLTGEGELGYNFVHGSKIKRLYVDERTHGGLARGRLAVVTLDGRYELVPAEVADKIRQRVPDRVVVPSRTRSANHQEEEYPDHPVPDDLIW